MIKRYRRSSTGAKSKAIEDLKEAFDVAEKMCPGVCDVFVKEVISSLTNRNFDNIMSKLLSNSPHFISPSTHFSGLVVTNSVYNKTTPLRGNDSM